MGGSESENRESVTVTCFTFFVKYYTDDKGERDGWDMWHAWGRRNIYRILLRRPQAKRLHGRSKPRWEGNG